MAYIRRDIQVVSRFAEIAIKEDGRLVGALLTGYYVGPEWHLIEKIPFDIQAADFMLRVGPGGVTRLERLHDDLARKLVAEARALGEVVSQ